MAPYLSAIHHLAVSRFDWRPSFSVCRELTLFSFRFVFATGKGDHAVCDQKVAEEAWLWTREHTGIWLKRIVAVKRVIDLIEQNCSAQVACCSQVKAADNDACSLNGE
eukprot:1161934-Pelagomonas_calceolata.AAC.13